MGSVLPQRFFYLFFLDPNGVHLYIILPLSLEMPRKSSKKDQEGTYHLSILGVLGGHLVAVKWQHPAAKKKNYKIQFIPALI